MRKNTITTTIDEMKKKLSNYKNGCSQTEMVYIENLRRMGGEKRLKIAFQLYEMALNLCKQNIMELDPDITDEEMRKRIFERFGYDTRRFIVKSDR